ncbi:MAG: class I SAM-dependent methyltransferase [Chloroflexota bacterium]
MAEYDQSINQQYSQTDLSGRILAALQNAGKDLNALTRDDLSGFDQFHIGGAAETRNLAQAAGLQAGMQVLDVGSGLGGPARTLAAEFGCHVTGIDLTDEYVRAAQMLTVRVGLTDLVTFRQGDATALPFPDDSFDVVWTQFTGMNIQNKAGLYDQFRRVLKNGGRLAIHEVMAGDGSALDYPVFWANDASIDFRQSSDHIRDLLTARGFRHMSWKELNPSSIEFFKRMLSQPPQPQALGFNVFIVGSVPEKATNLLHNLEAGRVLVIQTVFELNKS